MPFPQTLKKSEPQPAPLIRCVLSDPLLIFLANAGPSDIAAQGSDTLVAIEVGSEREAEQSDP